MLLLLHIVNGESFADKLKRPGIAGEILVWRESLYEGPAGLDLAESEMLLKLALYFDQKYGIPSSLFMDATLQQEKSLLNIPSVEHIVLIKCWREGRTIYI